MERELQTQALDEETYLRAKRLGFLDGTIRRLSGQELPVARRAAYKMVDTCAAEFDAQTPLTSTPPGTTKTRRSCTMKNGIQVKSA